MTAERADHTPSSAVPAAEVDPAGRPARPPSRRSVLHAGLVGAGLALTGGCDRASTPGRPQLLRGELTTEHWPDHRPTWHLALPEGATATIIALHGHGSEGSIWLRLGAEDLAQRHTVAIAMVDGGNTYWHARDDGTDTGTMVLDDLLPVLAEQGAPVDRIGFSGLSMGGYGALLLAPRLPFSRVVGVAAMSSALFRDAQEANPGSFDDAADFAEHALQIPQLRELPVWLACGRADSFYETNVRLAEQLPDAVTVFDDGGHTGDYWAGHWPTGIEFLARHV